MWGFQDIGKGYLKRYSEHPTHSPSYLNPTSFSILSLYSPTLSLLAIVASSLLVFPLLFQIQPDILRGH